MAEIKLIHGQYQEAVDCLKKALKKDYSSSEDLYLLGYSYKKLNQNEESEKYYEKAYKSGDDTFNSLSDIFKFFGKTEELVLLNQFDGIILPDYIEELSPINDI